jgi:DNA-binding NarL/FixJ family response regulator
LMGPLVEGGSDEVMRNGEASVRLVVADAHSLFREALATALAAEAGLDVVAQAEDGLEAVREVARTEPEVAVLDANLPSYDVVRATREIRERVRRCRVLVLAGQEDETTLTDAIYAGASGYMTKGHSLNELVAAIRRIHRGQTLVPPHLLGGLLDRLIKRARTQDQAGRRLARLTGREREVLNLLAQGGDNESIAATLVISPQTARTHIQNVLVKLRVHSRLEAAALAIRDGLLLDGSEPLA